MDNKRIKLLLRVIGFTLLGAGIILSVIGFVNFGNFETDLFTLTFIGLPCVAVGVGLLAFSFMQSISRFVKNEQAPVLNEFAKDISPAVQTFAKAVKDGLTDNKPNFCSNCGQGVTPEDKFCPNCGKQLD